MENLEFPCIESTVEFEAGDYIIRAWINEEELKDEYDNEDFKAVALSFCYRPMGQLARTLARLPRVNAVHVKRKKNGDGAVAYVNWP